MSDETQRELEQRALRNVRGLVDKMDGIERDDRRTQKRVLAALVVAVVLTVIASVWQMNRMAHRASDGRVVEMATPAAAK
jgi:predicted metal-binding membrane protein